MTTKDIQPDGTIVCPTCQRPHALFYNRSSDTKIGLFYLCNKQQRQVLDREKRKVLRTFKRNMQIEFVRGLNIEERWTKKYAKEVQNRKQLATA